MHEYTEIIQKIVSRIRKQMNPERIVLFGSRARGDHQKESDFDILIVNESDQPRYRRSAPLYASLADLPVNVDIMVYTPHEIKEWEGVKQAFVTTALKEGIPLYERQE